MENLKGGLYVSCQALAHEPLYGSSIMGKMAVAAQMGGAIGIRANTVEDIQCIQQEVTLPIIGIKKQVYDDCPVFITPTYAEIEQICSTGVAIVATDGTDRYRPGGELLIDIVRKVRENFPNVKLMADISTVHEAIECEHLGFDFIGTTLHGYTEYTDGMDQSSNDFAFLKEVLASVNTPVIAEGKINTPEKARRVLDLGCFAVVVGGAITRPVEITQSFMAKIKGE